MRMMMGGRYVCGEGNLLNAHAYSEFLNLFAHFTPFWLGWILQIHAYLHIIGTILYSTNMHVN